MPVETPLLTLAVVVVIASGIGDTFTEAINALAARETSLLASCGCLALWPVRFDEQATSRAGPPNACEKQSLTKQYDLLSMACAATLLVSHPGY